MKKLYFIALIIGIAFGSLAETRGQISTERQRAQEIATLFNKSKRKVKEKGGVIVQTSSDIRNEPVVVQDISEYSGSYKSDNGLISLRVEANGGIEVGGYDSSENGQPRYFKLRNAKIKDALLTGTKIYDDGATENFEAAFLNRTGSLNIMGRSSDLAPIFGLGVKYDSPRTDPKTGFTIDKLFYVKQ